MTPVGQHIFYLAVGFVLGFTFAWFDRGRRRR